MGDEPHVRVGTVRHDANDPSGIPMWVVSFWLERPGFAVRADINLPGEADEPEEAVVTRARDALHDIRSARAAGAVSGGSEQDQQQPDRTPGAERQRKWQENQNKGSGWSG